MSDLISRQAAIDLIESIETERLKGNIELIYAPAIKGLRALPPAQPEQLGTDLAEVGTDCISRQAAIVRTSKVIKDDMVAHDVKEVLKHLPSAEPKRGKWIDHRDEGYVECPFCRSATNCDGNIDELHYCFSCGAKMEVTE